jgi:hypothetical protein
MSWKFIGEKANGTSHLNMGKVCEDFLSYDVIQQDNDEILICCLSDGAGSAQYAAKAARLATERGVDIIKNMISINAKIEEDSILSLAESLYDELKKEAENHHTNLNEFSCTFLGCILYEKSSIFFQIGDGIIIRNDNCGNYTSIWLPQNGEYSNITNFLIDDNNLGNLKILSLDETINEVALTTDGLQMLILNNETNIIHQPFFVNLFKWLRLANSKEQIAILGGKLQTYLSSELINNRTDDDKTLFLATRLNNA